ncbi:ferric reductase NAD binding domain-containing protein [Cadophora sp. MPI-SDFR-AT-0126]|nr:ferric reductase NAD binding domain-containing protein [Leotiomycetes sp. MPI-SDFR-AT-0126]
MANTRSPYSPGGNSTAGGKNATAIAAAARKAAALKRAHQRIISEEALEHYAIALAGVIILFTTFHWSRFLYSRYASKRVRKLGAMKVQVSVARMVRHILTHRVPGFTSIGHAVLMLLFLLLNILFLFIHMDYASILPFAKRLGWMAIGNIAFVTFLALKNTPLAFLTAYSYERLNILHQVAGYTTVISSLLHGIFISIGFIKINMVHKLQEQVQTFGITAGVAMFVMMIFALLVRRIRYEVFYVSHITMFIILIVMVGLHQPHITKKGSIAVIFAGSIWSCDRILRGLRVLWYSYDNRATITPLVHGGTRIILRRSPSRAVPGTHCFLWIPKIRLIETHPFTIVSNSPTSLELVISAYDGFTDDLHNYAMKNPDAILRASIDGPYGAIPNFSKTADRVVLIAGGSGASFTFGIALNMLKSLGSNSKTTIEFIWTVREQETLAWFSKELAQLRSSPRVNITLHSTRPSYTGSPASPVDGASPISPTSPLEIEKQLSFASTTPFATRHPDPFPIDLEKTPVITHGGPSNPWDSSTSVTSVAVLPGRPNVDVLIREIVAKATDEERIAIAACGPDDLMWCVRKTATNCIKVKGPSIELHCEQFGW